ncbi:MAG: peptide chain release factor N(5)-glutamine methyltransferase [Deltaproteobacteria bacterium]|nr:peptide chain release factor N(5)-glutamine methyltransferase [Deltaproteobacteria bacterium]
MSEPWTVGSVLQWASPFLQKHGSSSARLDAELLLGEAIALPRLQLYVQHDRPMQQDELARFKALVKRRAGAEPVAYILGRKSFHAIELQVGPGALVPRPETEHLVDRAASLLRSEGTPEGPVIDVGTGTGAIVCALAVALGETDPERPLLATDRSPEALRWAAANVESLGLSQRITLAEGDLLGPFADRAPFAALLSNPPYIRRARMAELEPTVRGHEPHLALDGGEDGLDVLRRLVVVAQRVVAPGGCVIFELGDPDQGAIVAGALRERGFADARYERIGPGPTGLVLGRRDAA